MSDIALSNDRVSQLEAMVLTAPQVDLQTQHKLSGGMYARTIFIPAGTVLTGATHKRDHINVMVGDITVSTDEGMRRLIGFNVLETKAGMKRCGFAHADTQWTTISRTDLVVIEDIEDELVVESERLQTRTLAIAAKHQEKLA